MTFAGYEEGSSGASVWLYKWTASGTTYRHTANSTDVARDVNADGTTETWTAVAGLTHSAPEQTNDNNAGNITVTLPRDNSVATIYQSGVPTGNVGLAIYAYHRGDTGTQTAWSGYARPVSYQASNAIFNCQPVLFLIDRAGLYYDYGNTCNNQLYGSVCGIDKNSTSTTGSGYQYRNDITVSTLSTDGQVTTTGCTGRADGFFNGGFALSTGGEYRMVSAHTSTGILFLHAFESLSTGDSLTMYRGCSRLVSVCETNFSNLANFVGFPFVPDRDPHTQGLR